MEAPTLQPERGKPHLRLLEKNERAPSAAPASLGPWTMLFGTLAASGGHGVFLVTALTRLSKVPGRAELGGPLELAVLGWFVAAIPLAVLCVPLRARFAGLSARVAWSVASGVLALTLAAATLYLRAIALA